VPVLQWLFGASTVFARGGKKVNKALIKENDYFFIKPGDGPFKRWVKSNLNAFRWLVFYLQILFFLFISLLLVLLTFFAV